MTRWIVLIAGTVFAGSAASQYDKGTWMIEVIGGPVSPANPIVEILVYAAFPEITSSSAFGAGGFDVLSDDPKGEFFAVDRGAGLGASPFFGFAFLGAPTPGTVPSNVVGQLGILGCVPSSSMPISVWLASWTTKDFTPRSVQIATDETAFFQIYSGSSAYEFGPDVQLYPDKFEHGSAVIQVIPAPSGAILIAASSILAVRHRR